MISTLLVDVGEPPPDLIVYTVPAVESIVDVSALITIALTDFIFNLSPDINEVIPDTVVVDKFSLAIVVILPANEPT